MLVTLVASLNTIVINRSIAYTTECEAFSDVSVSLVFTLKMIIFKTQGFQMYAFPGGGVLSIFVRRGGCAVFQGIVFAHFLEQGIKRSQIFWSRLSKHVKRGNFVTTGYYLVKFLSF